ncbi:alpha/beta hydrolase family protein [Chryseobacterium indologenes]|uniref:alpha/beta hydrolase family protein n=1 Tax=Chryseobacterium indologenes TaxID=253 RepID=UPI0016291B98|nr:S9 family peptidase [Chryseobacterium indologenes]
MKKIFYALLLMLGFQSLQSQDIPLLDRALFFGNPEISGGKLSPDGKWISFTKEYEGIMNIWVKKIDEPFEKARPLTDSKRPLNGYFWSDDGKYILYVKDKNGDENMNIFAVDPMAKATKGVPESRNITPLQEVAAQIYMVSKKDPDLLMIGLNNRDKAWHDLYSLKISTGELKKIFENTNRITRYNFDWDEKLRIVNKTDEKGNTQFLYKDGDQLTPIYETLVTEEAYIPSWNEDNSKFYLVTNKGDIDKSTLFLMDPKTKETTKIESDPKGKVDFGNLFIDRNTRKIIATSYTGDKTENYWKDKTWEDNYKFLQNKFPGREIDFSSSTKDYSKSLVTAWGDQYASESYFFDAKTKELVFQYTPRAELKKVEKYLAPMTPITYKSSDGLEIPAYLTLPAGSTGKNVPVVVLVHGGPKGPRDYWGYNSIVQFLANRGYAVLQPNFRASGGYGKKFQNAGDLQWGKLMQDDITWGVKHLIEKGIADKNKVVIMGGSYGGYATLAGLAFTPEVYAAGVDIVGPSNLFTLLDSVPAYWESFRAALYGMVGDPKTEEGKKRMYEASPLFSVDKINKPLLIVQGANDPRVKQAEADQIVIALREKGKKVNYILADDEGHGFRKPVNSMAMYAETEKFLSEVIGGRYQKDMPENVAKRLKEMTVDIKSVTYTPAKDTKEQKVSK